VSARGHSGDGRHVDLSVGILEGEASQQRVGGEAPSALQAYEVYGGVPSRASREDPSYYDRPVLKEPVWIWAVPAYFYVGGAAGACAVLGEVAGGLAHGDVDGLVARCRWISATGGAVGTALLIHDLGRPERFLNMLRVFRPTSPMSIGSWVLAAAAPIFAVSAIAPHSGGVAGALGNLMGKIAGVLGMPLAGYTAVLLSNTAVPVWQGARRSLPYLFMASAASSAAALLDLTDLNDTERAIVDRFGLAGMVAEIVAAAAVQRQASAVDQVGKPFSDGLSGSLWKAATALSGACLALSLLPGRSRAKRLAEGAAGTLGGITLRFAVFHAGKASARDPRATFHQQRAGRGGAELHD
jgi:formate-dependent nitrite reductase membrane component NrfD